MQAFGSCRRRPARHIETASGEQRHLADAAAPPSGRGHWVVAASARIIAGVDLSIRNGSQRRRKSFRHWTLRSFDLSIVGRRRTMRAAASSRSTDETRATIRQVRTGVMRHAGCGRTGGVY